MQRTGNNPTSMERLQGDVEVIRAVAYNIIGESDMKYVTTFNTEIVTFLKGYKKSAQKLQELLQTFIESYNQEDKLNKNSTPMDTLLKGLRKTDCELVKLYFKTVTNGAMYLNAKGNYTVKLLEGTELVTNELYPVTAWDDMAKKVEVVQKDYYNTIAQALKAIDNTIPKAIKTARNPEELQQIIDRIKSSMKPTEN